MNGALPCYRPIVFPEKTAFSGTRVRKALFEYPAILIGISKVSSTAC